MFTNDEIRKVERQSIRAFLFEHREYLIGRVLDFGCGLAHTCVEPQPYRNIIESQIALFGRGEYVPFDIGYPLPLGDFDTVLMTQVLHLTPDPQAILNSFKGRTKFLVITYPTLWQEIQAEDYWRFTKRGMEAMLRLAGFQPVIHKVRWTLPQKDFHLSGGYGVIAEG